MTDPDAGRAARHWPLLLAAAAILLITTGARQSLGLYVAPLDHATGLGIASISLALAIGQFVWGASQPLFGAIADRHGSTGVIVAGAVLMAMGFIATPLAHTTAGLVWTLGMLSAAGAGAGSFSILIAATAQRLAPPQRSFAAGFINAGASFGQFLFAPLNQALIGLLGWVGALSTMGVLMLATVPLAWGLRGAHAPQATGPNAAPTTLRAQLAAAAREPSYWYLNLGFMTCGFHVAFLVTHLPTEVRLCGLDGQVAATSLAIIGLANIGGSLAAGIAGNQMRLKWLLFWVYLTRAAAIAVYLAGPRTGPGFYLFAAVLGLTWLSTVPPTIGLVAKLFGTRYLATLFGLALLAHQVGGFLGAWLGGQAMARFGNYSWMWYADIVLALGAAIVNLPIREAPLRRVVTVPGG